MECNICKINTFPLTDGTCWASVENKDDPHYDKIHQFEYVPGEEPTMNDIQSVDCKHDFGWDNQQKIGNYNLGKCSYCKMVVRIECLGWDYSGDVIGWIGVTPTENERITYLN